MLVDLYAAGLNPADTFFRQLGGYVTSDQPFVLGHDGMGVVRDVGPAVTSIEVGDRVAFCNGGLGGTMGTYAEATVLPDWQLARVPDEVDDLTAAALPLVAITCWEALYDRANLQAGEHVLIHGGAGGTGHVAIQLARLRGGKVATTVSSPEKAQIVSDLGAELAVNYREEDVVAAVRSWSGGVDVALDNAGPEVLQQTYKVMAPYGRIVTLMGTPGDDDELSAYNQNLTIHNVMMLTPIWHGLEDRLGAQAEIVRQALALVASGDLTIRHAATFALAEAGKAQAMLESGAAIGKVTLRIRE
ncbi:zinc-binding dehydrogenase [Antarcticimicrobium luteum]|uniref:zinc-binding dehydrogenase n=1 Tax=Antarcticimicrobium luteum TaxID=2547397 RepID=UPI00197DB47F|nr:zinc-binding dehydrogenase [Antarcticimicrobium luteum]